MMKKKQGIQVDRCFAVIKKMKVCGLLACRILCLCQEKIKLLSRYFKVKLECALQYSRDTKY